MASPTDRIVPIGRAPGEAIRLAEWAGRQWGEAGIAWGPSEGHRLAEEIRHEAAAGRLLVAPDGSAVGLALWTPRVPVGRRAVVALDEGYGTAAALSLFLDALRTDASEGPLLTVEDPIPGIATDRAGPVLRGRGFARIERVDCRFPAERPLPPAPPDPPGLRTMGPEDAEGVARLLADAYRDFPLDLALFRHHPDPEDDLAYAAHYLLEGGVGPWWPEASFAVPDPSRPGRLLAMVLVNERGGPLITELGVAPEARGRGYGRSLLGHAIRAVRTRSDVPIRLVVTLSNRRAHALYRSLGFVDAPETRGGRWIDPVALGLRTLEAPYDPGRARDHQA